jgi:hypothetical protein
MGMGAREATFTTEITEVNGEKLRGELLKSKFFQLLLKDSVFLSSNSVTLAVEKSPTPSP